MDELDDEVAMISNKKSHEDMVSHEEIKIEVKSSTLHQRQTEDYSQENRNFNTMPRNYSASMP
jgi:hypothetical protein